MELSRIVVTSFLYLLFLNFSAIAGTDGSTLPTCPKSTNIKWSDCQGEKSISEGIIYNGEWKNGLPHGRGSLLGPDPQVYVGDFYEGTRNGYGFSVFEDQSSYLGEWANNAFDGEGTLRGEDKNIIKEGIWSKGEFVKQTVPNHDFYSNLSTCEREYISGLKKIDACTFAIETIANAIIQLKDDPIILHKGKSRKFSELMTYELAHRATGYEIIGNYEKEIEDLKRRRSVKLRESDSVKLGVAYFGLGKCDEAQAYLNEAITSNPNDEYVKRYGYFHSGIVKIFCNQKQSARIDLEKSYELNTDFIYPVMWLFINYKDTEKVKQILSKRSNSWQWSLLSALQKLSADGAFDIDNDLIGKNYYDASVEQKKCEANFYFGWSSLIDGNVNKASNYLQKASGYCPQVYFESMPLKVALVMVDMANKTAQEAPQKEITQKTEPKNPSDKNDSSGSIGSAFRVSNGYFVTNYHVINDCVEILLNNKLPAYVYGVDKKNDLSILRSEKDMGVSVPIRITPLMLNETVTVAGYPLQTLFASAISITSGNVSRTTGIAGNDTTFQISAPIQPGNSGGPVIDNNGNLIGVVVSTLATPKMSEIINTIPQNINFAIKANTLKEFLESKQVTYQNTPSEVLLSQTQLGEKASAFTALVSCNR